MTTLAVGNRRLLKLADHLETIPRGSYSQHLLTINGPRCAIAHWWETPEYKRANAGNRGGEVDSGSYFALRPESSDWHEVFGVQGLKANGKSPTTGKQAAKRIRVFVAERAKAGAK